jgi:cytoskeleton protein RodZ
MIEAAAPDSGGLDVPAPPADENLTAGAMLQRAREAAGLHVAALAVSLKVPVRKLEALEADRYEQLSDAVFVRALAASVCRTLKIDSQPVLDRLPHGSTPRLIQDSDGLNAPFRAPRDGVASSWPEQLSKPVILSVFGLLLGAVVLFFLPRMQSEEPVVQEPRIVEVPSPEAAPAADPATGPAANAPAAAASSPAQAAGAVAATAPVAAATPPAVTASAASVSAPAEAASGIVLFRARQSSWVEVTDAKGAVTFRQLLAPGETGAASGELPLRVTVGRVDATEVQVRGKPFDLRPVSRDNVARFEVK